MKIKEGFVLRDVAGQAMVIATGEANKRFKGMIKMNSTAKDIWLFIEQGLDIDNIVLEMSKKYNESEEKIKEDVNKIVKVLIEHNIVEE